MNKKDYNTGKDFPFKGKNGCYENMGFEWKFSNLKDFKLLEFSLTLLRNVSIQIPKSILYII